MPKLPQVNLNSDLEVVEKSKFDRGGIVVPKKVRKSVVKSHFKLVLALILVIVLLGLLFVMATPFVRKTQPNLEEQNVENVAQNNTQNFKDWDEEAYETIDPARSKNFFVDKVDKDKGILEALVADNPEERYFVRVSDKTKIVDSDAVAASGSTPSGSVELALGDINYGAIISVISLDDPKETKYINAAKIDIIIKTNPQ